MTVSNKVRCNSCRKAFDNYKKLALHILASKKNHKRGKKWAAKYIMINGISPEKRFEKKERTPLTEEEKQNKKSSYREVSGQQYYETCRCPNCNGVTRLMLPVEYIESNDAWRNKNGVLMVLCGDCRS